MKIIIKQLKAPWPNGACIGDVVEFEGVSEMSRMPAWSVGKCDAARDDAEAGFLFGAPAAPVDGASQLRHALEVVSAELTKAQEQIAAQERAIADVTADRDALLAELTKAQEQIAAAGKKK